MNITNKIPFIKSPSASNRLAFARGGQAESNKAEKIRRSANVFAQRLAVLDDAEDYNLISSWQDLFQREEGLGKLRGLHNSLLLEDIKAPLEDQDAINKAIKDILSATAFIIGEYFQSLSPAEEIAFRPLLARINEAHGNFAIALVTNAPSKEVEPEEIFSQFLEGFKSGEPSAEAKEFFKVLQAAMWACGTYKA